MPTADREKWDAKYGAAEPASYKPSAVLVGLSSYLPAHGRALDVAGGAGRNAIWLAQCGLAVTIADVSPVGLALARQRATDLGVAVETLNIDLEQDRLEGGSFKLIVSVCYLWRPLFAEYPRLLNAGGTLVVVQPTLKNLERNDKPPAAYLLNEGELPRLVSGLEIVHYEEGWLADGRHDAVFVARKTFSPVYDGLHERLPMKLIRVAAAVLNQTPLDWDGNRRAHPRCDRCGPRRRASASSACRSCASPATAAKTPFMPPARSRWRCDVLDELLPETRGMIVSLGLPLLYRGALFNAACLVVDGQHPRLRRQAESGRRRHSLRAALVQALAGGRARETDIGGEASIRSAT